MAKAKTETPKRYAVNTLHGRPFRKAGRLFTSVPRTLTVGEDVSVKEMTEIQRCARRPGKPGHVLFVRELTDAEFESVNTARAAAGESGPQKAEPKTLRDIGFSMNDIESMMTAERAAVAEELGIATKGLDDEQLLEAIEARA